MCIFMPKLQSNITLYYPYLYALLGFYGIIYERGLDKLNIIVVTFTVVGIIWIGFYVKYWKFLCLFWK